MKFKRVCINVSGGDTQMIDLKATNIKLRQRSKNILRFIGGPACSSFTDEELEARLVECNGSVKLAAATLALRGSVEEAEESLRRHNGVLAKVIEEGVSKNGPQEDRAKDLGKFVVCVDAGGSSCKAAVIRENGEQGLGESGPCNV